MRQSKNVAAQVAAQHSGVGGLAVAGNEINEIRAQRFAFVLAVYRAADGDTMEYVQWDPIAEELSFDSKLANKIVTYLREEHLLEEPVMGNVVAGFYFIVGDVGWQTQRDLTNAGHSRGCELIESSNGPLARAQEPPSVDTWLSMSTIVPFSAGDYVYLNCNHDNPTALAISHGSANDVWTTLSMLWVAPPAAP